jgi:hypothetical protein
MIFEQGEERHELQREGKRFGRENIMMVLIYMGEK